MEAVSLEQALFDALVDRHPSLARKQSAVQQVVASHLGLTDRELGSALRKALAKSSESLKVEGRVGRIVVGRFA